MSKMLWVETFVIIGVLRNVLCEKRSVVWRGGGAECETKKLFFLHRHCHAENVIATKAVAAGSELFVITPRFKRGVPATIWKIIEDSSTVRLQPFLDPSFHTISNCEAIQNAVDFQLDSLGNLWILDSGVVETLKNPKCTCHPKVVVVNVFLKREKVKRIELTSVVQPESVVESVAVELRFGRSPFIYVSDAGTGRVIVHDVTKHQQWTVTAGEPTSSMRLVLVKRKGRNVLAAVRQNGWLEVDTEELKRGSHLGMKSSNEDLPAITLRGSDIHHIYFQYQDTRDVFVWKIRQPFSNTSIQIIHTAEPELNTVSVCTDSLNDYLILDTDYADFVKGINREPYQKLTFVPRIKL